MKKLLLTTVLLVNITACTWVNENERAQSVAIRSSNDVQQCEKAGNISVSTKYKVGFVKRGISKVTQELQTLARNEALKLNANVIVPESEPQEGKQTYQAFRCL